MSACLSGGIPPVGGAVSLFFTTRTVRSPPDVSAHPAATTEAKTTATRDALSIMRLIETSWPRKLAFLLVFEQGRSDHQSLDLAGPFVDLGDFRVAEVPLDREICEIAVSTK